VLMQGFLVMFAYSMPLAGLLTLLSIAIECRSDAYKITWLSRRATAEKANGFGVWTPIIESITWMSILTNCWLFFFGSGQAKQWWPTMFDFSRPKAGYEANLMTISNGRWIMFYLMLMEHILVALFMLVKSCIPDTPQESVIEGGRRAYLKAKAKAQ